MGLLTNAHYLASPRGCLCVVGVLLIVQTASALGQNRPQATRRTTTVHWDKVPLGDALVRLSATLGEPIFTDRRVDPDQRISLEVTDAESDDVLSQTAAAASLGTSRLGQLIYFGPPAAAAQLRTLAVIGDDQIAKLAADRRSVVERKRSLDWQRLAEPRQLVTKLVEDRGLKIAGAEQIPHDLWPAGSLPAISFAEQLTVLLIGFDLTFVVDVKTGDITLVPINGPVTITRRYRLPSFLTKDQLQQQLTGIDLKFNGSNIVAVGMAEDHERIANFLRRDRDPGREPPVPAQTRKLYTLRIEQQSLRGVLQQLGQRLGWAIETDDAAIRAAGKSLDERVSFAVEKVDEDELLRALLGPAGLEHERDGNRVRVFPKAH